MWIDPIQSVNGRIEIPASKSYSQRAIIASWLAIGKSKLLNIGHSDDEKKVLEIISKFSNISKNGRLTYIDSNGLDRTLNYNIDIGESGLAARLISPIIAMSKGVHTLSGSGSILSRSMESLITSFYQNQATIHSTQNHLPLSFSGPIPILSKYNLDGMDSSQIISGWLFALSAIPHTEDITLSIRHAKSIPYIEMSVELLRHFGALITMNNQEIIIHKNTTLNACDYVIEGDWSSASMFIVAAILNGNLTLDHLNTTSLQADRAILSVLDSSSTIYNIESDSLYVSRRNNPKCFQFDATNCPDLFPALSVLAAFSEGTSEIKGLHRLFNKESDRAKAIKHNLELININIKLKDDSFLIEGSSQKVNKELCLPSFGDHRIVMMNQIIAMKNHQKTFIEQPEVVSKSFPTFFDLFHHISIK